MAKKKSTKKSAKKKPAKVMKKTKAARKTAKKTPKKSVKKAAPKRKAVKKTVKKKSPVRRSTSRRPRQMTVTVIETVTQAVPLPPDFIAGLAEEPQPTIPRDQSPEPLDETLETGEPSDMGDSEPDTETLE